MKSKTRTGMYIVVETETNTTQKKVRGEVHGPFKSMAEAERWMLTDAVETYNGSDRSLQNGDATDWGSDMYVCEIVRVCRPVPVVTIAARIMDLELEPVAVVVPAASQAQRRVCS